MGLRDYDDYNNDDVRGRRGTRKTAVVIAFGILIALIILVVYLIANPDKKVEIAEKKTSESIKSEEKVDSASQSGKTEKLFNFTTQSSLTESTEEIKESDVTVDAPSHSSFPVVEVPESEIVEVEVPPEETAVPEENETPVVDESVYEETPSYEETPLDDETSGIEIIPQEEVTVEEESTTEEKTKPEEDISLEEEVPALEEITVDEEDAPVDNAVVEEQIKEEEVLPVLEEITAEEEDAPVDNAVIEEQVDVEEVLPVLTEPVIETEDSAEVEKEVYNPFEGVDSSTVVKSSEGVITDGRLIIRGKSGSAVYSLFSGEVVETGRENGLKYVVVRSSDGRSIKYTGFERVNVKNLSIVKESSLLGSIGSSASNTIILEYIDAE